MSPPKARRRRRDVELAPKQARDGRRRRVWLIVSFAVVIGLQAATTWDRLDGPFLDGRLHYTYDNADSGFRIRNGIRNGDLRSQSGVTTSSYDRWGERTGSSGYYTHHPFLIKTVLQLFARVAGVSEWTTRAFYLLVAMATAAGFLWIMVRTTRNLFAAAGGAAVLVTLPLFAVYQISVKFEADGMLVAVWIFAAFLAHLGRGTRATKLIYAVLVAAAFPIHWTAGLFVVCLGAYQMLLARRLPRARELVATTVVASAIGLMAILGLMIYLHRGWHHAVAPLVRASSIRAESIPLGAWIAKQLVYLGMNFTWPLVLAGIAMSWLLVRHLWQSRRASETTDSWGQEGLSLLAGFIAVTVVVACLWVAIFRQGSFVHVYWQYWFCLPIAALVTAAIALAERRWRRRGAWRALACGLVVWLFVSAERVHSAIVASQLGRPEDIEFLRSLRSDRFARFVFVPLTDTPLNQWFQGPLFPYYTDRDVFAVLKPEQLQRGDKLLVLRFQQRAPIAAHLEKWSGLRLANEKCGLRFCAYDTR